MAKKKGGAHKKARPLGKAHKKAAALDGGQCVSRHGIGYKKNNSCSHRWQAAYRATEEDPDRYRLENPTSKTYEKFSTVKQDNIESKKKEGYRFVENKPEERALMTKQVGAFETGSLPWPNDAHHIVPIGSLDAAILTVVGEQAILARSMKDRVMEAPYNINYWKNMIILPRSSAQGLELGLPTHKGSHPKYSKEVKEGLIDIFREAFGDDVKAAVKKNKKHENAELAGDVAKAIMDLQQRIYDILMSLQDKVEAGRVMGKSKVNHRATQDNIKIDAFASGISK